jgi:hypothetical protein
LPYAETAEGWGEPSPLLGAVQSVEPGLKLEAAFFETEGGVVGDVVAANVMVVYT